MLNLVCRNVWISEEAWIDTLLKIDDDIMKLCNDLSKVVVISLPYKLSSVNQVLTEFISNSFVQQSMLFCCDLIMEYVVSNKYTINKRIRKFENLANHGGTLSIWTIQAHDSLISTEAVIFINTENGEYVSIPRDKNQLHNEWKISWKYDEIETSAAYTNIISNIFDKISNKYLSDHFRFIESWSHKFDFSNISLIGYLCDDGEVVKADILRQRHGRIFIHLYDGSVVGSDKKYEWISVPNDRICAPPKHRPIKNSSFVRDFHHCNELREDELIIFGRHRRRRTANKINKRSKEIANKDDQSIQLGLFASCLYGCPCSDKM